MNFKTTVSLLILLACVGIFFLVQHFVQKHQGAEPAPSSKLISATTDQITQISITPASGTRIVLQKNGSDWRLLQPISAPADKFAVDDLLRALTSLDSRGKLPTDRAQSVGLVNPRYVVEVTAAGKTTKLQIGDANKIGDSLYVLADDQKEPQIVATALSDQLDKAADKPAATYRSKKLTPLDSGQTDKVTQIALTRNGKTVRLEKHNDKWEIVQPKKMPADSSAISSLLFAIADLNADEFVENPTSPASYGLTHPTAVVWCSTAPPTTNPSTSPATQPGGNTIDLGRYQTVEQKDMYAQVDNGPIAIVSASTLDSLSKTALDLRDKVVVDFDPAHVERFTLSVDRAATTQPTSRPAAQYEYTIARRKETTTFGPLPPPSSQPLTQPAAPTTQPVASRPTSGPSSEPSVAPTQPATEPALATIAPAATQPLSKWEFESGNRGDANDGQVQTLLDAFHPLRAEKFLETSATTQPAATYNLLIHVGPANGQGPQDLTLRFTSPGPTGNVIGTYQDLTFEVDRSILEKLDASFK